MRAPTPAQRKQGAEMRNETPALHSITSSACASNNGGMVTPSVVAVFRFRTKSNLVGRRTGRSLVPGALQDHAGIKADLAVGIVQARAVTREAAHAATRGRCRS